MRFSRNWIGQYLDLPADRELTDALSALGLVVDGADPRGDDLILDLDVPSNRPDVMSHLEVAREVALALGARLRPPDVTAPGDGPATADVFRLDVEDTEGCPRFVACTVTDVEVGPSPAWLVGRLESIGLRSINAVVDVTNFVMWELGRPMHAYDLDRLAGGRLMVRRARSGEKVLTLDEVERELAPDDLVIADGEAPVGLAGVMGGELSGVTRSTRRVLLECACFDPRTVRAMARRHGMHTDASHRFERGMSRSGILAAVRRAAGLIAELCGGRVAAEVLDVEADEPESRRLELRAKHVESLLGAAIEPARTVAILEGLGFTVGVGDGVFDLTLPPTRLDITRPVDVIEEIARFHGYESLPGTLPVLRRSLRHGVERPLRREARVRDLCAALGYWQTMTQVFSSDTEQEPFLGADRLVELANPLNDATGRLRGRMLPGLLGVVARNANVGAERIRLFEIGRVFAERNGEAPHERRHLVVVGAGLAAPRHPALPDRDYGFDDLKGTLDTLAARMRWPEVEWASGETPGFQGGSTARVTCGGAAGVAGKVDPAVAERFGIERGVWALEIEIEELLYRTAPPVRAVPPARFPAAERDVTLLVPAEVPYGRLEAVVAATEDAPLESLALVALYHGEDIPEGRLAMTLRLTFRSRERTLTAEEIESGLEAVLERLESDLDAVRR